MNHVILLVLTECAKLFCEGVTFAITVLTVLKKKKKQRMKDEEKKNLNVCGYCRNDLAVKDLEILNSLLSCVVDYALNIIGAD